MPPTNNDNNDNMVAVHARHPRSHPRYRIHLEDLNHAATAEFTKISGIAHALRIAAEEVFEILYQPHGTPQAVRSVTLVLESMGGVAYTTGIPLDNMHKEIHLSLEYISTKINDPARFRDEVLGVVTHEMTHCWQHDCCGTAPGGLVEGIADFVRLKADLAPPHWKRGKESCGDRWDQGYEKTGFFLEWLEHKYGRGTVSRINDYMDGRPYQEAKFWDALFGESVESLWNEYRTHCGCD